MRTLPLSHRAVRSKLTASKPETEDYRLSLSQTKIVTQCLPEIVKCASATALCLARQRLRITRGTVDLETATRMCVGTGERSCFAMR